MSHERKMDKVYLNDNLLPCWTNAGEERVYGCLPNREDKFCSAFSDEVGSLPKSEWRERDHSISFPSRVKNQHRTSACNGFATSTAGSRAWQRSGQKAEDFSPYWCYGLMNGGVDQGSTISDAARMVMKYGFALESEVPEGAMFERQFPKSIYKKAEKRQAMSVLQLRAPEDVASALTLEYSVVIGIAVGRDFDSLDKDGIVPIARRPIGGHAIELCGIEKHHRGMWKYKFQNSWGDRWGWGGFGYITEAHMNFMGRVQAFAIRSVEDHEDTNDTDPPKVKSSEN